MFKLIGKIILLCIGLILTQALTVFAQPEVIGDGWILSSPLGWAKVAIYKYDDVGTYFDTIWVATVESVYPYDYEAHCHVRFPWGWVYDYGITSTNGDHLEFYMDSSNRQFYYDPIDDTLIIGIYPPYYYITRYCPGRPVFDQENNIHMIWEGRSDTLFYGFSTDTLNTIEIIDTLTNMPPFMRLAASPDNNIVGAVFYDRDADSLYKFLATTGEPIDFSEPPEAYYFDTGVYPHDMVIFYDIMLDWQGRICLELNRDLEGCWAGWGCHYYWSEEYGFRYLRPSWDDVQECTMFEICFGPYENEILLIDSGAQSGTQFFHSPDGGNTWFVSGFYPQNATYGSARRIYADTLDFVYSHINTSYYYAIPRDTILYELTGTHDDEVISPASFSLSNHPNPFNSSTTISFTLSEAGMVNLSVYNIQGQRIAELFQGMREAGEHAISWDASDYPSGVYFARLEAGGSSKTAKMVLLK
ncbi:MAG: T9SS type A sorting domain-containing protein [Candidatus Zixiibacteriota bacterium]|nr:MAG: T9SS type A sorting domain-containing protein [candidate division Zixibacteria bacterium]